MKILIAPDSFKDSLTAGQAAATIASGWQHIFPQDEIITCPMADGGEGSLDAVLAACHGERRGCKVNGPLGEPTNAYWGWLADSKTAVIEMAQASGIQLLNPTQRDACISHTYGTGELIKAALNTGAERIILTLGGSATNDAGSGMLRALGVRFLDANQQDLPLGGIYLSQLVSIELSAFDPRIQHTNIIVAADVRNPLCGSTGASSIFGPQKGASLQQVEQLDAALAHFADLSAQLIGRDQRHEPGAGAAGGVGFAATMYLNANFQSGVDTIAALNQLKEKISGADWVITGEGKCDAQTLQGKTVYGVAKIAQSEGVPVIVLAGALGENYQALYEHGVSAAFSISAGPSDLAYACEHAETLLYARTVDLARCIKITR